MPKDKVVLHRHSAQIESVSTSHGVGEKRIIATQTEVGKPITQIARTLLHAGEQVEMHVHPTMDEHFFFMEGECCVSIDGNTYNCVSDDYLFIPARCSHQIDVVKDTLMLTIGIEK